MQIPLPAEQYNDCRQICRTLAGDILQLTKTLESKDFLIEGLLLLHHELLVTDRLLEKVSQRRADAYAIKDVHYDRLLQHISGIVGIAILYLEALRLESLQRICGKLLDLIARLRNAQLAAT